MPDTNVSWEDARKVVEKRVVDGFDSVYGSLEPDKIKDRVLDGYRAFYHIDGVVEGTLRRKCLHDICVLAGIDSIEAAKETIFAKIKECAEKDAAEIDAEPFITFGD